jgi:hypothetical protein
MFVDHADGSVSFGRAFRLALRRGVPGHPGPVDRQTAWLVYLRRTKTLTGSQVLSLAKRAAAERGFSAIQLQDAAVKCCSKTQTYDLSFRCLLEDGRTWYERHGFRPTASVTVMRQLHAARDEIKKFKSVPVALVTRAVQAQCNALTRMLNRSTSTSTYKLVTDAFFGQQETARPSWILWHRRRLLSVMQGAKEGATLGEWLLQLPCLTYARVMFALYGHMHDPAPALESVSNIKTPSVDEFRVANAARRLSHKITWVCDVRTVE